MAEDELWWFNNKVPHESINMSNRWRVHLIFDLPLLPGRDLGVQVVT
jgi:hypothetical protein